MTQYQLIFFGLFGFFLYPFLTNTARSQRQNACLALGVLCLGVLAFEPALSLNTEGFDHPFNVGLAGLSFLFIASGMIHGGVRPGSPFPNNLSGLWACIFSLLTTVATSIQPSVENLLLATTVQIICLLLINRNIRFQSQWTITRRVYFSVLFPLTFLATKLHAHGLVIGEHFGDIVNGLYWVLLASATMNLLITDLKSRHNRTQYHHNLLIEPSAMRLAYRGRRILKDFRHDLRQPLSTLGILASVGRAISKDPEVASRYSHIQTAQKALKNMLEEFFDELDTSIRYPFTDNLAPLSKVSLDAVLQPLVDEYRLLAQAKGLELRYVQSNSEVQTNTEALTKILRSGLDNAIKYTEHGGAIIGVRRRHDHYSIQIVDTGPGVDTNPSQQHHKGWGHGSTIVQDLSDQILAHTECRNRTRLGRVRGSVFEVCLPKLSIQESPKQSIGLEVSTRLCASVIVFSEGATEGVRLHFPEESFDEVGYAKSNNCRGVMRKSSNRSLPVYIAFAETHQETRPAKECLNTLRAVNSTPPCCILLHPVSDIPKKRVEFSKELIVIPYLLGQPENAFKILAELFPSRSKANTPQDLSKKIALEAI